MYKLEESNKKQWMDVVTYIVNLFRNLSKLNPE